MWQFPEPLALVPKWLDAVAGNLPPWDKRWLLCGCVGISVHLHGHVGGEGDSNHKHALLWGDSSGGATWLSVGQEAVMVVARASAAAPGSLCTWEWHIPVR